MPIPEKHKTYHIKDEQLNKDGFKKYIKHEHCPFENCRFSKVCNHIHCIRPGCSYVLHSSGQLYSHKVRAQVGTRPSGGVRAQVGTRPSGGGWRGTGPGRNPALGWGVGGCLEGERDWEVIDLSHDSAAVSRLHPFMTNMRLTTMVYLSFHC